jgi:hypothetical protein
MTRFLPHPMNLRIPYASVMFWRPARERGTPSLSTRAIDTVAATVFGERAAPRATPDAGLEFFDTVVEVVTQAARADSDPDDWPLVSIGFERALRAVNELLAAIGSATGDLAYRPIAVEELDAYALVSSRRLELIELDSTPPSAAPAPGAQRQPVHLDPAPYLLSGILGLHLPADPLTDAGRREVNDFLRAGRRGHPFLTYHRLVRRARRSRESGDYAATAVMAAASGEVLLNLVLRGLLVEDGTPDQIPILFDGARGGFTARLRREYAGRLGRRWDLDDPTNEVGHWFAGTFNLRHRVVHAGHEPTAGEAGEAIHGAEVLEAFVIARMVDKRFVYPKTTLSLIGEAGLARRRVMSGRLATVIANNVGGLQEFWQLMAGS